MIILRQKEYGLIGRKIAERSIKEARKDVAEAIKKARNTKDPKVKKELLELVKDARKTLVSKKEAGMDLNTALWATGKGASVTRKIRNLSV